MDLQERGSPGAQGPGQREAVAAALRSPWLSAQAPGFAEALLAQSRVQAHAPGRIIISFEEESTPLCFLLKGAVEMAVQLRTKEMIPLHFLTPGHWFGEHGAMTGRNGLIEYRARSHASVLVVARRNLLALAEEPGFAAALCELMALVMGDYLRLAGDLMALRPENRVRSKILSLAGQAEGNTPIPLSQEELGILSCASRPTVSKVLGALASQGAIKLGYRSIRITDRAAFDEAVPQPRRAASLGSKR